MLKHVSKWKVFSRQVTENRKGQRQNVPSPEGKQKSIFVAWDMRPITTSTHDREVSEQGILHQLTVTGASANHKHRKSWDIGIIDFEASV